MLQALPDLTHHQRVQRRAGHRWGPSACRLLGRWISGDRRVPVGLPLDALPPAALQIRFLLGCRLLGDLGGGAYSDLATLDSGNEFGSAFSTDRRSSLNARY